MAKGRSALVTTTVALLLVVASCGNSPTDTGSAAGPSAPAGGPGTTASAADLQKKVPVSAPGVTDTEIRVGGVASVTNILQADYAQVFKGTQAYFDKVNSEGGIYGRKLVLAAQRDDRMVANTDEVKALVAQDNVFAILPVASLLFSGGASAGDAKVPTFGWNINDEWGGSPYLFGEKGSYLCADCAYPYLPWLAQKLGLKNVGLLAYGSQPQSKQCADGVKKSFERWPTAKVSFEDSTIAFGATDMSVQVSKMRDANVDLVLTCIDTNGALTLGKEMKKQDLKATQYLQNGYDFDLLGSFGDVMEGSYVGIQFVPFEASQHPPALKEYFDWIAKVPGAKKGELSMAGWMSAQLFVEGLKMAGPEFSRDKVVGALNTLTNWTADGIGSGVDWTIEHDKVAPESCFAMVKVENKAFVPQFGEPGKPFICIGNDVKDLPNNPPTKA
jgi:branched-chain amino acid transport system substrate-binding protein